MFLVTTPINPTNYDINVAREFANRYGYSYIERRNSTISYLLRGKEFNICCVIKVGEIKVVKGGVNYFFHPNMAMLRIDNLIKGKSDRLMDISETREGDQILDCTLGMGSDTLVFAQVVGDTGRVTGIESSPILAELVNIGFNEYNHPLFEGLKKRISIINSDYGSFLKKQSDKSFDIVYFDPMFDNTFRKANGLDIVRDLAEYRPLVLDDISEAKRVARRYVVIKDGAPAKTLKRLNIPIISKGRKTCYGRIEL